MKATTLLKALESAGVVIRQGEDYLLDLTHFNEYGRFILTKALDPKSEKCPECGKVDHEDCGCNDAA